MTRTPKKLAQVALTTTLAAVYTAPALATTQVVEMWVANNAAADRIITVSAHGTATANIIVPAQTIGASGYANFGGVKIVLTAGEILGMKVNTGSNEVYATIYGIEEA